MTRRKPSPVRQAIDFIRSRAAESEQDRAARKRAIADAKLEDETAKLVELERLRRDPDVLVEQQRELRRALTLPGRELKWADPGYEMRIFEQVVWRVN